GSRGVASLDLGTGSPIPQQPVHRHLHEEVLDDLAVETALVLGDRLEEPEGPGDEHAELAVGELWAQLAEGVHPLLEMEAKGTLDGSAGRVVEQPELADDDAGQGRV